MAWIDSHLEKFIIENFPDRKVYAYHEYRTWQSSRYLYVTTVLKEDRDLHYEYIGGSVELHLEGKYQSTDYKYFAKELRFQTSRNPRLHWLGWQGRNQCRCRIDAPTDDWEQLLIAFKEIMSIFDPIIEKIISRATINPSVEPYKGETDFSEEGLNTMKSVSLRVLWENYLETILSYQITKETIAGRTNRSKPFGKVLKRFPMKVNTT